MGNAQGKTRRNKYSKWDNAVPPAPPSKPTIVPGTPRNKPDLVTLRWEPPINDGGAPVSGYLVEHRRTGSPHWVRATPDLVVGTEVTLSGLEPGWRYQFRVSAENCAGQSDPSEVSEPLTVTLSRQGALAPHFVLELKDTVALENDKVEFVAVVRGHPTPTISWYKDGSEVFSDRRMRVVTEKDQSMLVIFQASFSDEGEIKCSATNRLGHSVSRARLKLEAPPTIRLSRQYEDGLLFEKDEVLRLKVSVAGRPLPRVTWFHSKQPVVFGGRHEVRNTDKSSSLRVSDARRSDSGEYQVRATNRLGEHVATFTVTVTDRPLPPGKPQIAMILGRSLTLSWTEPQDDGGFRIETYIVEYYRLGWNVWLKAATCRQLTTTLSDLIEGSEYRFRVKAENPYGVSEPSPESDVIFIPDPRRGLLQAPTRSRSITMGDVDSRLSEDKMTKHTEVNRMSKEVNLRTTSAGALQTYRSSVIPKKGPKNVSSSEEISTAQRNKADTLPNVLAQRNDRLNKKNVTDEIQQKRVVDNRPEMKTESAARKTINEASNANTTLLLKEVPKISSETNRSVTKTNIMRDTKEKLPLSNTAQMKLESSKEVEVKRSLDEKGLNHTTVVKVETKQKDGGNERKPEMPVLQPSRKTEQAGDKEVVDRQFSSPLTPREDDDSIMHGSSELMLVLLPDVSRSKRTKGTERREEAGKSAPKDGSPPRLSLSAPALDLRGSYVLPPLRNAVSSSQLLHEKAMARFYEAVAKEERQLPRSPVSIRINSVDVDSDDSLNLVGRRSSAQDDVAEPPPKRSYQEYEAEIDRVRSKLAAVGELKRQFAFRQSLSQEDSDLGDAELEDEVYDDEEDVAEEEEEVEEEEMDEEEELEEEEDEESEEEEEIEEVPKHEYRTTHDSRKTLKQKLSSLSQDDEDYEDAEERTYHPRCMVPVTTSRSTDSPEQDEFALTDNVKHEAEYLGEKLPRDIPLENLGKQNALRPEAEHEVRQNDFVYADERAGERPEQSDVVVLRPKKPEAPETPGQEVENIDADVALSAAEIARQRRLKVRQKSVEEDFEANQAIVNLYGDIIREYGTMRKARTVMYLNTEDLKNAAYSSEEMDTAQQPEETPPREVKPDDQVAKPISQDVNHHKVEPRKQFGPQPKRKKPGPLAPPAYFPPPEATTREIRLPEAQPVKHGATYSPSSAVEAAKNALTPEEQMKMEAAGKNVKFFVTFMTDLALFAVACWLYFFKDERLAIPVLIFMVYRQAVDAIKKRLPERWTRR